MATVYPANQWQDGDTLQPDQPNVELQILAGEMNGHLDRDNIAAGSLGSAKFALNTFHVIGFAELVVALPVVNSATYTTVLAFDLKCDDGFVEITGQSTQDAGIRRIAVRVDGHTVAEALATDASVTIGARDSSSASNVFPVGAGIHRIELVVYNNASAPNNVYFANLYARNIRR